MLAHAFDDGVRRSPQAIVPDAVTVPVVDLLEAVEIHREHGGRVAGAAAAILLCGYGLLPAPAVEQPGERIGPGLPLSLPELADEPRADLEQGQRPTERRRLGTAIEATHAPDHTLRAHDGHADVGADAERPRHRGLRVGGHRGDLVGSTRALAGAHTAADRVGPRASQPERHGQAVAGGGHDLELVALATGRDGHVDLELLAQQNEHILERVVEAGGIETCSHTSEPTERGGSC